MNRNAVFHRSTCDMCYAADNDTVVIRLLTGKDIDKAFIICADPFLNELTRKKSWYGKPFPMTLQMELEERFVWTFRTSPKFKRLQYYFKVVSENKEYYLFDNKLCPVDEAENRSRQYYKYPWLNPSDVISPPQWVRETVWYQIMPDRFCRSAESETLPQIRAWGKGSLLPFNNFFGGNLKGITERLPYLRDLGIGGIYLTPIFSSNSYHRYNTFDYKLIDPMLGTEDDMRKLVKTAHSLGIRIMLDGVFNHCGTEFMPWQDVCKNGRSSPYYDWFFINDDNFIKPRFDTADGRFYTFSFWSGMPKLNTNNPEVIEYFTGICSYWVREWDIDGIRFDVGDEISHTFLRELRRSLKPIKPDLFLLGEIWFDSINWLTGTEYDSVMNYPLSSCINDFAGNSSLSGRDFMYALNKCLLMYPEQVSQVLFNFLDTHDTMRVTEECQGNTDLLIQRLAMLMTLSGTPCIYYGTEIALRGKNPKDNRSCMPWSSIEKGEYDEVLNKIKELIAVRNNNPQLSDIGVEFIHHDEPRLLHYIRTDTRTDKRLGVYINAGSKPFAVPKEGRVIFSNLFSGDTLDINGTVIYEI